QVDDASLRPLADRFCSNCLQDVRLTEANRGMQEKRVEAQGSRRKLCNSPCRGKCHAVRRTFNEGIEGVACIQRRAEHRLLALRVLCCTAATCRSPGRLLAARCRSGNRRSRTLSGTRGCALFYRLDDRAHCRAHDNLDAQGGWIALLPQFGNELD